MSNSRKPTQNEKEEAVFNYLRKELSVGVNPSIREICTATKIKSTSGVHKILCTLEEKGLIERDNHSSRSVRLANSTGTFQVPLLGRVTAGEPIFADGNIEEYLPVSSRLGSSESLFALRVVGLSMKNAGIMDGDTVVADSGKVANSGDIVIALIDEEATVKRLGFENEQPVLYPENPDFSPIHADNIKILGTVVGCFRMYC